MWFFNYIYRKTYSWSIFGESVSLIKFIGLSFVILGISSILDVVDLNPMAIFSFSASGILFILSDFAKYYTKEWDSKKALGIKRMKKVKFYRFLNVIFLFCGIFLLIGGPYLKLNFLTPYLEKLGPTLAFIAIGLTVLKIGLENDQQHMDTISEIINEVEEIIQAPSEKSKNK